MNSLFSLPSDTAFALPRGGRRWFSRSLPWAAGVGVLGLALAGLPATSVAAPVTAPVVPPRFPTLAVPRASASIKPRLDASPDDPAWKGAARIPAFGLSIGADPRDAALPTSAKLLWDEQFLYVRFECRGREIYTPFPSMARDQKLYQGDVVEIFIDVVGDGKQVVEIQLSPKNQLFDQQILLSTEARSDEYGKLIPDVIERDFWDFPTWNCAGLRSAARRTPDGWIGELAIPAAPLLRRLESTKWAPQTVRAHLMRYKWTPDAKEKSAAKRRLIAHNWAPVQQGCPHISPQVMGFLQLQPAPPKTRSASTGGASGRPKPAPRR